MELVDKKYLPCLLHFLGRIFFAAEYVEDLGISHHKFAASVVLLDERLTGERTSVVFIVKLAVIYGKLIKVAVNRLKEIRNPAVRRLGHTGKLFNSFAGFNLLVGASAAAVSVAEHTAGNVNNAVLTVILSQRCDVFRIIFALIRLFAEIGKYLVTAVGSPAENAVRKFICIVIEKL